MHNPKVLIILRLDLYIQDMLTCIHVNMALYGRVEATHFETGWCFQLCSRVLRGLMISVEQHPLGSFEELYNRLVHFLGQELEMTLHRRRRAATGIEHLSSVFQAESPGFEAHIDSIAEQFMLVVIRAVVP